MGEFVEIWRESGFDPVDLGFRSSLDLHPNRVRRAAQLLRRDVDLVHLHGFNPSLAAALAPRGRCPIVYTEHRPLEISGRVRRIAQTLFLRRGSVRVVAVSEHTRSSLLELLNLAGEITVVHNGLFFAPPQPRGASNDPTEMVVAFVGRMETWKRPRLLLEAVSLMKERHRVRVLMIGDGPLSTDLRSAVETLGLQERVQLLGYRRDADALLASADVLVHPAAHEPFGLVIVEAAAQGTLPIVAVDGGGAIEAMPPGSPTVTDAADLARSLDDLVGSPALNPFARRQRMEWARAAFPIERTAREYLDVYLDVIGSRRGSALVQS
jgi:glycosyltransferase involved in cell wall biosynthesis